MKCQCGSTNLEVEKSYTLTLFVKNGLWKDDPNGHIESDSDGLFKCRDCGETWWDDALSIEEDMEVDV